MIQVIMNKFHLNTRVHTYETKSVVKNKQLYTCSQLHIHTLAHEHRDVCTYSSTMDDLGTTGKSLACFQ